MSLDLWPECEIILKKHFVYDKIFDLLFYEDLNILEQELKELKKDVFDANYRFIFYHFDTEYYLYPGLPGLILTNLQRILTALDIPNYFCLIITNHFSIKEELEYLQKTFTNDSLPIGSIITQLQQCHVTSNLKSCSINNNLKFKFSCLNHARRSHRVSLISLLNYKNLLEQGMISYVK